MNALSASDKDPRTAFAERLLPRVRLPFGPSPLEWGNNPQDTELDEEILSLIDVPPQAYEHIHDTAKNALRAHHFHAKHELIGRNHESFRKASLDTSTSAELAEVVAYAKDGKAYPSELIYLMLQSDCKSLELAKLTHPYGEKSNFLNPMMSEIAESLFTYGAELSSPLSDDMRLKFFPYQYNPAYGIVVAKNDIAYFDNHVVTERRIFGFQAEDTSLAGDIKQRIMAGKDRMRRLRNEDDYRKALDHVFVRSGLQGAISEAIDAEKFPSFLIPFSTTIYMHEQESDDIED